MLELYPPVRIDLMRAAITAFGKALNRYPPGDRKRFKRAEAAVFRAVKEDSLHQLSYLGRCHAFRNLTKDLTHRSLVTTFREWLKPTEDGKSVYFDQVVIDAIAIAPVRGPGTRFLKSDFVAAVKRIASGKAATAAEGLKPGSKTNGPLGDPGDFHQWGGANLDPIRT